jgi:hypothetical protein
VGAAPGGRNELDVEVGAGLIGMGFVVTTAGRPELLWPDTVFVDTLDG